jgi:hypothetical protein
MKKHLAVLGVVGALICFGISDTRAQQYPMLDQIATKVVQKYQNSSCAQIQAQRAHPQAGKMQARVVQMLHDDAQMRQEFLNRVAAPIANKLFECNLIP